MFGRRAAVTQLHTDSADPFQVQVDILHSYGSL
jgi:hypothetical protein